jgi:hypothetical protein
MTPRQQILLLDFLKSGKMGVLLCGAGAIFQNFPDSDLG